MEAILHRARDLPSKFLVATATIMMILHISQCEDSGAAISWNGNDTITSSPICDSPTDDCGLIAHHYMDLEFLMDSESSRRILQTKKITPPTLKPPAAYNCGPGRSASSCTGRKLPGPVKDACKGVAAGVNYNRACNRF